MTEPTPMLASVIIPTLNEERHIDSLLAQLVQEEPHRVLDILVADGGSTDRTRQIVAQWAARDARVRLVDNPERHQAAGVNKAALLADPRSAVLLRVDAHAAYPRNYLGSLLTAIEAQSCESVVVRLRTVGESCFQQAVAAVCNSRFGTGGSVHRMGGQSGFVDHGHHAAMRRDAFSRLGGYDTSFLANEDAEFDSRLRAAGGRIWFAGDVTIDYAPRRTVPSLARQYFRYGAGRAGTFRKHGSLRLRQMVPPLALLAILCAVGISPVFPAALLLPLGYTLAVAGITALLLARERNACLLAALFVLPTIHFSWAAGFWKGLLR